MIVELIFHRNMLDLDAREVYQRIENRLAGKTFPFKVTIQSATVMSKWLLVLADFEIPTFPSSPLPEPQKTGENLCFSTIAGIIVDELQDYAVRYRNFEIHGEGKSLLFKKDWTKGAS